MVERVRKPHTITLSDDVWLPAYQLWEGKMSEIIEVMLQSALEVHQVCRSLEKKTID